jgi:hypothetical protein
VDVVDLPAAEAVEPAKGPGVEVRASPPEVTEAKSTGLLLQQLHIKPEAVVQVVAIEGSSDPAPFAAELYAGQGVLHSHLGFIYQQRPDRYDDLTLIRNVAENMQNRLNEIGIYTFRQIALWSPDQQGHVAQKVKAKDRIGKEQWQTQARKLYQLKYGEPLGPEAALV